MCFVVHVGSGAVGLVVTSRSWPTPSTRTHSFVPTHDTSVTPCVKGNGVPVAICQAAPWSVDIATFPFRAPSLPATTHSSIEEHDTAVGATPSSNPKLVRVQVGGGGAP